MTAASLARAEGLAELGRWEAAAGEAARVLAAEPGSVEAMCLLARCHSRAGRHMDAVAVARTAAAIAPGDDDVLRVLATFAAGAGHLDEALRAAGDAVRIDPQQWVNQLVMASTLIDADRHRDALGHAVHAVRLAPHEAVAHNMLGIAYAGSGDKKQARVAYHEALRLDPQNSDARNNLAVLDLAASRLGRAAAGIAAGLRDAPQETVLRENLDVVGEALVHRLLNAMLLSGFLVVVMIGLEQTGAVPAWWPRAIAGLVLLGIYAAVAWSTLRHLPAGMRRHLRSLPRRSGRPWRWVLIAAVSTALLLAAFAPGSLATVAAVVFVLIIRGFQLMLVVMAVRWVFRTIRRGYRKATTR